MPNMSFGLIFEKVSWSSSMRAAGETPGTDGVGGLPAGGKGGSANHSVTQLVKLRSPQAALSSALAATKSVAASAPLMPTVIRCSSDSTAPLLSPESPSLRIEMRLEAEMSPKLRRVTPMRMSCSFCSWRCAGGFAF